MAPSRQDHNDEHVDDQHQRVAADAVLQSAEPRRRGERAVALHFRMFGGELPQRIVAEVLQLLRSSLPAAIAKIR